LRKLALAIHIYADVHSHFPRDIVGRDGKPALSWRVLLLPYLDLDFLHAQFKLNEPWDSEHNAKLAAIVPDAFRAPTQDRRAKGTYYQAVAGPGAVFDPTARTFWPDFRDGTANTLLLVEAGPPVPWTKPADIKFDPDRDPPPLAGPYTDVVHVVTADATTFRMAPKPDAEKLRAFITRDGAEVFDPKDLRAAPARPRTPAEEKELAETRSWAQGVARDATGAADDRFRAEAALRRFGPVPHPDPKAFGSREELYAAFEEIEKRRWADLTEFFRLIELLEKSDPKASAAIRKARADREEAERNKK
jgi:hypothetical protein